MHERLPLAAMPKKSDSPENEGADEMEQAKALRAQELQRWAKRMLDSQSRSPENESAAAQLKNPWPLHAQTWLEEFVKPNGYALKLVHEMPVKNWRLEEAEAEAANERIRQEVLAMPKLTMEELKALRAAVLERQALAAESSSSEAPEEDLKSPGEAEQKN